MKNEKELLVQLFKLATKQQKIIERLAQDQKAEENIQYLTRACQTAAANCGFTATDVHASHSGAGAVNGPNTSSITTVEETYTVSLSGAPKEVREKFVVTFKAQVQAQKPDLANKLSIIFND